MSTVLRAAVMGRLDPKAPYASVAACLREISRQSDRIFVWGRSTEIYVLAERPGGARFSFCDYLTGASPRTRTIEGEADTTPNIVWTGWDMLFDDLDRRQTRFLADTAAGWEGDRRFQIGR